ncbi:MAG TPA: amidase family protein, partial [Burkholderiaceae bacterium]|nr:amidase family protein [Burkholderiaceae bacterium]
MPLPSLRTLHTRLRAGETTATALMQSCIDAYNATENQLQAYKTWNGESALKQAQAIDTLFQAGLDLGPLMGMPLSAKDLFVVPPMPTFAGTTRPLEGWHQAGPVIQSVQAQLGVITGKTHTVEFAFGGIGMNPHWGTPRNPWDA